MKSYKNSWSIGIVVAMFLMLVLPAQASVLATYTDRTSFSAASSGVTTVDFSSLGLNQGGWAGYSTSNGLDISGVKFVGNTNSSFYLYAYNPNPNDAEDYNSGTVLRGPEWNGNSYITMTMPTGVTAFGLDLATILPSMGTLTIQLDGINLGVTIQTQARPNLTFFGVTTDAPISEVKVLVTGGTLYQTQPILDNVTFGTAGSSGGTAPAETGGETPEITTILYVGSGIGLLMWNRRRRAMATV